MCRVLLTTASNRRNQAAFSNPVATKAGQSIPRNLSGQPTAGPNSCFFSQTAPMSQLYKESWLAEVLGFAFPAGVAEIASMPNANGRFAPLD
jgi:hypothetical protein